MDSTRPVTDAEESSAREFENLAAEHRAMIAALEGLEDTSDPGELRQRLSELRELLENHFAGEEADDGLPKLIGSSAPHLMGAVERIFDEHRRFLADLGQLEAEASACIDRNAELQRGVTGFVGRMCDHERRETSLINDAVNIDLGPGD